MNDVRGAAGEYLQQPVAQRYGKIAHVAAGLEHPEKIHEPGAQGRRFS